MAATIHSLVSDVKRNRLCLIGPLTEEDVLRVWEKVAKFVETLMLQQKGLSIAGLGTFTFSKRSIDVGNNKAIVIQRPVFVLSEKFIQTHSLHCIKKHTSGQIPLHTLNFTQLSNETGVSRELAEGAVREVLQALSRAVATSKSIEFDLRDVGRLTIHDGKAKMSFFREFVYRLDGCSDMEEAFRVNTAGGSSICSIMSNPTSRPSTTLSLPRIVQLPDGDDVTNLSLSLDYSGDTSAVDTPLTPSAENEHPSPSSYDSTGQSRQLERDSLGMATISEEEEEEDDEDCGSGVKKESDKEWLEEGVCTVDENGKIISSNIPPLVDASTSTSERQLPQKSSASRANLVPKPAVLMVGGGGGGGGGGSRYSGWTSAPPTTTTSVGSRQHRSGPRGASGSRERGSVCRTIPASGAGRSRHTTPASGPYSCSQCPSSSVSRPLTCSHQSSVGLCYLCHQRALRNVPIDLSREREATEKWHRETLQEFQRRSELLSMARTQAEETKRRLVNHRVATFNQNMAGNIKKQREKKSSRMDPSYVFCDRLATPAPYTSQMKYCRELDSQVVVRQTRRDREREEAAKAGREEQERLAKDLAAYDELYRKIKAQSVEEYKAALNEQTSFKPTGADPPSSSPSSSPTTHQSPPQQQLPVFGVHKVNHETCERRRAKEFFLEQLAMVEEKKTKAGEEAVRGLKSDADTLKVTKEGLKKDLRKERGRRVQARKSLEEEWLGSMREKQRRLLDDLQRAREQGIRLHQQCERYQRCKQCQRKLYNVGKSNILHETRYISGSRLMV